MQAIAPAGIEDYRFRYTVLHAACANNAPYSVLSSLVRHYPAAAHEIGGFHVRRLAVEFLFVDYFLCGTKVGAAAGSCVLNERAYYGLKGYVRWPQELTQGPWSDFWRKSSLLLVAGHRRVPPEQLLKCSNISFKNENQNQTDDDDDDCYADPLILVMVAEAIEYLKKKRMGHVFVHVFRICQKQSRTRQLHRSSKKLLNRLKVKNIVIESS